MLQVNKTAVIIRKDCTNKGHLNRRNRFSNFAAEELRNEGQSTQITWVISSTNRICGTVFHTVCSVLQTNHQNANENSVVK